MRKILLFIAVLAFANASAQKTLSKDYSYKVSEPYKVIDGGKFYFSKDNQVMSVKFDDKMTYIQKFDAEKPALISRKEYKEFFPKNYVLEAIREINDKFYLFYSSWDGKNDKEQLFYNEIDFATGEFIGASKMILQIDGKVTGTYSGRPMDFQVRDKFNVMASHDKKNFLITYRKKPEVKRDTKSYDIIGLASFDGNLNKLSVKEHQMPYTERRMNNLDFQIDNKGNLYMLTKVFHDDSNDDKKKKKDSVANYHVELFTVKSGSDKVNISKLENKDKFLTGLWIFDSPSGDLVAGGYYSNGKGKNWTENCDGIITFKMNPDGAISNTFYYDIPLELINEYESAKSQKKNNKKEEKGEGAKFTNLKLKNLQVQKDGSMVLVGEQDFVVAHTTTTGTRTRTYYTYHYNDILISKISPSGTLEWMKKVPKQQRGLRGQGGMSYNFFSNKTDHFLVFLDNVKNIGLSLDKQPALHSDGQGGYLTAVKLSDATGDYTKGSILDAREVEDFKLHQFATNRIIETSDNSFVLEAYKKSKEDVMIQVVLQ